MRKLELHWQILISIIAAGIVGGIVYNAQDKTGVDATFFQTSVTWMSIFNYIGTLFLNALKMIIVPLITSSIIIGVAGIGSGGNLGALGGKTLLFYASTTLAAILVGLVIINVVGPGYVDGEPAKELLALDASTADLEAKVAGKGAGDVANIFLRMVPPNILKAAADGQMLGVIFFSILFGYFMTHLDNEFAEPLYKFWNGVFHVMMRMTEWIMKFAPIGVFGLVAGVIAKAGYKATGPLLVFSLAVIAALAVHALVTLPLLLRFVGRVHPFKTMRASAQPMLTAFSSVKSLSNCILSARLVSLNPTTSRSLINSSRSAPYLQFSARAGVPKLFQHETQNRNVVVLRDPSSKHFMIFHNIYKQRLQHTMNLK